MQGRSSLLTPVALAVLTAAFVAFPIPRAAAQVTFRVSVDSSGVQTDFDSGPAVISSSGRFVAFTSTASNLVPNDMNFAADVFVHDRVNGTTILVSTDSAGVQGNVDSVSPVISTNGRFVAFASLASNLDPNDMNGTWDVFLKDLSNGALRMVSVDSAGVQGNLDATNPAISSDGRFVAYQSYSDNLVPNDTNSVQDIFLFDTVTGETKRASVNSAGQEGDGESITPSISTNGVYVAFASASTNLFDFMDGNSAFDIFVRDFATLQTTAASVGADGFTGNSDSLNPTISADGFALSFNSFASNLVVGDTNGVSDIFVRDIFNGTTERVSVSTSGTQASSGSIFGVISGNGRYVGFRSSASNLVAGDTNFVQDVFVRDRVTGTTVRVSVDATGAQANDESNSVSISNSGRFVAFTSYATNLIQSDTNFASDVFVHDGLSCAPGNVNSGAGPVANVLDVNGSTFLASVGAGAPITVTLAASPAGPSVDVPYALWVWRDLPVRQELLTINGSNIGCTMNPTPFTLGRSPQPFKCVRGGLGAEYCLGTSTLGASPASAPWSLTKPSGLPGGTILTLQGVIRDDGASNPELLSVTNAVILRVN